MEYENITYENITYENITYENITYENENQLEKLVKFWILINHSHG